MPVEPRPACCSRISSRKRDIPGRTAGSRSQGCQSQIWPPRRPAKPCRLDHTAPGSGSRPAGSVPPAAGRRHLCWAAGSGASPPPTAASTPPQGPCILTPTSQSQCAPKNTNGRRQDWPVRSAHFELIYLTINLMLSTLLRPTSHSLMRVTERCHLCHSQVVSSDSGLGTRRCYGSPSFAECQCSVTSAPGSAPSPHDLC